LSFCDQARKLIIMTPGFDRHELQRRRRDQGLQQNDLASLLGVTQQAVSKWELGRAAPEIDLLPTLAVALGCRIDDLFTHPEQPPGDVAVTGNAA
jgi:transcriptional regulator with XRE-family HTH domain